MSDIDPIDLLSEFEVSSRRRLDLADRASARVHQGIYDRAKAELLRRLAAASAKAGCWDGGGEPSDYRDCTGIDGSEARLWTHQNRIERTPRRAGRADVSLIERVEIQLRDKPVLVRTFEVQPKRADVGFRWLDFRIYDDTKPGELRALGAALIAAANEADHE